MPGEKRTLNFEMKVIADVGLLGLPNAGKSTLIRAVSAAQPRVADYPFTTLYPNLGVVDVGQHRSFVMADIPGLIEGAAEGAGLGHRFLKHLQRTGVLLHLIDMAPPDPAADPVADAKAIVGELKQVRPELAAKPRWLVINKMDLLPPEEAREAAAAQIVRGLRFTGTGVPDLRRHRRGYAAAGGGGDAVAGVDSRGAGAAGAWHFEVELPAAKTAKPKAKAKAQAKATRNAKAKAKSRPKAAAKSYVRSAPELNWRGRRAQVRRPQGACAQEVSAIQRARDTARGADGVRCGCHQQRSSSMKLAGANVLITGANRGIGLAFARARFARGANKVYACARNPGSIPLSGVIPLQLDVNSPADIAAAVRSAGDTTLVINNAGIAINGGFRTPDAEENLRRHLETNVLGVLRVSPAFAPVLARNGGGALLNVASIASFFSSSLLGNYAVSKSAVWSLSNGLRHDLRAQGTQVATLHMAFVDTDLTQGIDMPKSSPEEIVARAFDGIEAGAEEILADELTRQVKAGLVAEPPVYLLPR